MTAIPDRVEGWRFWYLTDTLRLVSFAMPTVWQPGRPAAAVCEPSLNKTGATNRVPHQAPDTDCNCGLRVMPALPELLAYIRQGERSPAAWLLGGETVFAKHARTVGGPAQVRDRTYWTVLDVPDVIGRVRGSGRVLRSDRSIEPGPGEIWRCELVEIGDRLYLSPHLRREAPDLAEAYQTEVVVGSTLGYGWLPQLQRHESEQPRASAPATVSRRWTL